MKPRPLGKRRLIKHLDYLEGKDGGSIKIWFYGQGFTFYDVKSACEFYLKYFSRPLDFVNDFPKYKKKIDDFWRVSGFDYDKFNRWLFRFTFKSVLGD